MKPLVYYCRWQGASLRLRGRDGTAVWGHFVYTDEEGTETMESFRFLLKEWQLTVETDTEKQVLQLDDMGTVVEELSAD